MTGETEEGGEVSRGFCIGGFVTRANLALNANAPHCVGEIFTALLGQTWHEDAPAGATLLDPQVCRAVPRVDVKVPGGFCGMMRRNRPLTEFA